VDGASWASKLYLPAFANLETAEFSEQTVLWRAAPASWREAMDQRCLAGGLQVCNDERSYFALFLGGRKHVIHTKYLSCAIDLALDDGGPAVIVRV
jgi:hypothetical protein